MTQHLEYPQQQISQETEFKVSASSDKTKEPIAIIGIGCRFPGGANSPEAFWKLLRNGVDAITEVPSDRWNLDSFYDPQRAKPGKMRSRWGGFVDKIDEFDAHFFGISPREAAYIDPQQRMLLEVAWEALEDGGQVPEKLAGSKTGVFVGTSTSDYYHIQLSLSHRDSINAYTHLGGLNCITANRISYIFNFKGPSMAVDTACSSALVAVHLACQSIWNGESALAIAGGVSALLKPEVTIGLSRACMLSPDGRCFTFDERANGYVRAEGVGVVVLKPLSQAQADKDPIYAVIRSSVVNQDGHTNGITVPNGQAQEAAILEACKLAGISPEQVQYVEAHGTGTPVGDPIETNALGNALGKNRPAGDYCTIGSVKTNIGHLEPASGIAGLIKLALALKYRQIPPSLHFQTPNSKIPFEELRLRVPTALEPWSNGKGPRLAGINCFGFGGTNAHAILAEAPQIAVGATHPKSKIQNPKSFVLPLSARSSEALKAQAAAYKDFLTATEASLSDICYSASLRRGHHDCRVVLVADSKEELAQNLEAFLAGETRIGMSDGRAVSEKSPKLAFVFSGMGQQWWAMGRQLLESEPVFLESIQRCDFLLRQYTDWSLLQELTASEENSRINSTQIAQCAIFSVQIALAALWRSWGIIPEAIVGHSVGEVAAAYVAGVLSLEDAVRVIFHRSRLQAKTAGLGKMLAVGLSVEEAERVLAGYEGRVSIAVINSPTALTLAGETLALEDIAKSLEHQQIFCRFLQVEVPYHSPLMEPLKAELTESLQGLAPQKAAITLFSTVTDQQLSGPEVDEAYWAENMRNPVLFAKAVKGLLQAEYDVFLEIGARPVLVSYISECSVKAGKTATVLPSLRHKKPEQVVMLRSFGKLYTLGYPVDWHKLYPEGQFVRLPSYPWQRKRYWNESEESQQDRLGLSYQRTVQIHAADASPQLSHLAGQEPLTPEAGDRNSEADLLRNALMAAEPAERQQLLESRLCEQVARVLETSAAQLDCSKPLTNLGLDSLMAVDLSSKIKSELSLDVSIMKLMLGVSISQLVGELVEQLTPASSTTTAPSQTQSHSWVTPAANNWLVFPKPNPDAHLRLFCFPYNGGSCSAFLPWSDNLPSEIEVCALQLPGGIDRLGEQPFDKLTPLVETLARVLLPYLDKPFAFYGHSVGALFSFEVARHLRRENGKVPAHLFIGALDAPQLPYPHSSIAELSDSEFIEKTSLFDFPESVRQNSELMRLLLPTLKTAILIRENYTHTKSEPLDCPISVFGGMQDKLVPQEHLSAWCEQTRSTFKLQMLPGNHLFLHGDQELLLQALSHELASLLIAPQK